MYGFEVEKINLKNQIERDEVEKFLERFGLILDKDVEHTLVIRDNGSIKATCSKAKNVLKCFAVSDEWRGEGVTATLITALIDKLFEEGIYHSFIFTKPDKVQVFEALNFKLIHKVDKAALLENGLYDINKYLDNLIKKYDITSMEKTALVMNCNPFTLGHKYLIEKAAKESEEVIVFIVEEDKSLFPFKVRYNLVKEGVAHLKNVKVIPGGEYIISSATFPSYFLREEGVKLKAYTELDANIFGKYFCRKLNITKRYVGKEPFCNVTRAYNETLESVLRDYGVELVEIERKENEGKIISASMIRELIKEDKTNEIKYFVPENTFEFLSSNEGKEIMEKIKVSNSPH